MFFSCVNWDCLAITMSVVTSRWFHYCLLSSGKKVTNWNWNLFFSCWCFHKPHSYSSYFMFLSPWVLQGSRPTELNGLTTGSLRRKTTLGRKSKSCSGQVNSSKYADRCWVAFTSILTRPRNNLCLSLFCKTLHDIDSVVGEAHTKTNPEISAGLWKWIYFSPVPSFAWPFCRHSKL